MGKELKTSDDSLGESITRLIDEIRNLRTKELVDLNAHLAKIEGLLQKR